MQPIDPADKRKPYVQIAASIRAAILTGELEPGSQLPTGHELAAFFGVSSQTVANAIRALRDEGFVRSRAGSGVYVRDQASLPGPDEGDHPLAGVATFLFEMGHLKQLPRSGWLLLGVPQPESVAEHSFRVGLVGVVLAAMEGADVGRTAALGLMHDAHETRIGDVPSVGRAYVTTAVPEAVTAHQTSGMPDTVAKVVQDLTAEYEAGETLESRVAHDADKIETLLQAVEYQDRGHDAAAWRETSIAALRTDAGRQLAQAIGSTDPHWWAAFAASYHELRASTRASIPDAPLRPPIVAAIITSELGVLIERRRDGHPLWTFPAGEAGPGETAADAAIRETEEETGLRIKVSHVIGERTDPATGRRVIYLAARPYQGTAAHNGDEAELAEVKWAGAAEAAELLTGLYEPVREHLAHMQIAEDQVLGLAHLAEQVSAPGNRAHVPGTTRDQLAGRDTTRG